MASTREPSFKAEQHSQFRFIDSDASWARIYVAGCTSTRGVEVGVRNSAEVVAWVAVVVVGEPELDVRSSRCRARE